MSKSKKIFMTIGLLVLVLSVGINMYSKNLVKDYIDSIDYHEEVLQIKFHKIDLDSGLVYKVKYQDMESIHMAYAYVDFLYDVNLLESYSVPNYEKLITMVNEIEISDIEGNCITEGDGDYDISYTTQITFPANYDIRNMSIYYDIYYYIGFPYGDSKEVFGEDNPQFQFTENNLIATNDDGSYIMEMKANAYYNLSNKGLKESFINQENMAVVYVKSKDYVLREIE